MAHVKRSNAPEVLSHAFRQQVGGHYGIYEREGAARYPIHELYGPATTQMMYSNENVLDAIEDKMAEGDAAVYCLCVHHPHRGGAHGKP